MLGRLKPPRRTAPRIDEPSGPGPAVATLRGSGRPAKAGLHDHPAPKARCTCAGSARCTPRRRRVAPYARRACCTLRRRRIAPRAEGALHPAPEKRIAPRAEGALHLRPKGALHPAPKAHCTLHPKGVLHPAPEGRIAPSAEGALHLRRKRVAPRAEGALHPAPKAHCTLRPKGVLHPTPEGRIAPCARRACCTLRPKGALHLREAHVYFYGIDRTMCGPIAVATGTGSRFHSSIADLNFGFAGLWSGIDSADTSAYSQNSGVGSAPHCRLNS